MTSKGRREARGRDASSPWPPPWAALTSSAWRGLVPAATAFTSGAMRALGCDPTAGTRVTPVTRANRVDEGGAPTFRAGAVGGPQARVGANITSCLWPRQVWLTNRESDRGRAYDKEERVGSGTRSCSWPNGLGVLRGDALNQTIRRSVGSSGLSEGFRCMPTRARSFSCTAGTVLAHTV